MLQPMAHDKLRGILMQSPRAKSDCSSLRRRDFVKATAITAAGALAGSLPALPTAAQRPAIEAQEHWVSKGSVKLYLYRKRQIGGESVAKPVLFLVHGSTFSSRGSY